ncbi:hypothetical protein cypCar_00043205, partial [Cyprinus carpio]
PPENPVIFISPSVIVEGDSVTLSCSSDSNPPALNFSWFKGGTFVGSGRNYNISNISSDHSGVYKCKSRNEHGEKYSDAVTLNIMFHPGADRNVTVITTTSGGLFIIIIIIIIIFINIINIIIIIWFIMKQRCVKTEDNRVKQICDPSEDTYTALELKSTTSDLYDTLTVRVSSAGWGVSYRHSHICALKNSSVVMSCTYTYPTGYNITKVFWTKNPEKGGESPDLSEDPEYSQRLQYLGDTQQSCTIRLSHVTQKDQHMYCFRFRTDKSDKKWIGTTGVSLTVTDPPRNVSVSITGSGVIVEGDSVTLSCSSDSNPPALNFSWFFKENKGSAVGIAIRVQCTYRCTLHPGADRNVIVIAATSGGLFIIIIIIIIIIIWFIMRKQRSVKTEDLTVKQNDLYADVSQRVSVHDESLSEPDPVNDALYASVKPSRFRGETPESRDTEEIQYATVQYHRKKERNRPEEDECQYDDIRVHQLP